MSLYLYKANNIKYLQICTKSPPQKKKKKLPIISQLEFSSHFSIDPEYQTDGIPQYKQDEISCRQICNIW